MNKAQERAALDLLRWINHLRDEGRIHINGEPQVMGALSHRLVDVLEGGPYEHTDGAWEFEDAQGDFAYRLEIDAMAGGAHADSDGTFPGWISLQATLRDGTELRRRYSVDQLATPTTDATQATLFDLPAQKPPSAIAEGR